MTASEDQKKKEIKPPETFRSHLPAMAGSLLGTFGSATLGSHLDGRAGTEVALLAGSVLSGTLAWWGERAIRRSQAVTQAKIKASRMRGRPLSAQETQVIQAVAEKNEKWVTRGIHYRTIALLVLLGLAVAAGTVFSLDKLGARQVANLVPAPVPTVTKTVTPLPVIITSSPASSASPTPSASPDLSPGTSASPSGIASLNASPSASASSPSTSVSPVSSASPGASASALSPTISDSPGSIATLEPEITQPG